MAENVAGRIAMIQSLLGGEPVLDENGWPTGELSPRLISINDARKLLGIDTKIEGEWADYVGSVQRQRFC